MLLSLLGMYNFGNQLAILGLNWRANVVSKIKAADGSKLTLTKTKLLSPLNQGAQVSLKISSNK